MLEDLQKCLIFTWIPENKTTKIAVLITDAPCHGKEFHDNVMDNYLDLSKKKEADNSPIIRQNDRKKY